jgi:hypothetical protein
MSWRRRVVWRRRAKQRASGSFLKKRTKKLSQTKGLPGKSGSPFSHQTIAKSAFKTR